MVSSFAIELLTRDHAPNNSIPTELCTLDTCSITQAQVIYDPSLGGNVFFAALFALLFLIQIILGVYYRTWAFTIGLAGGLILEICGYIGRIQMHYNPFITSPFYMYVSTFCVLSCLQKLIHGKVPYLPHARPDLDMCVYLCLLQSNSHYLLLQLVSTDAAEDHCNLYHLRLHLSRPTSWWRRHRSYS
jgi:hypothetical protein